MIGDGEAIARLDDVTHRYGKVPALEAVTLALPAGRVVGLIGPDGVGKSSLLGLIAGVRQIQSGKVCVLDGDIADAAHRAAVCPASPSCRRASARTSIPISACARTSNFSAAYSGNPV